MYEPIIHSNSILLSEKRVALPDQSGSAPPPSPVYTIDHTKITQNTTERAKDYNHRNSAKQDGLPHKGNLHRHCSVVINQEENPSFYLFSSTPEDSSSPKSSFGHSYTSNLQHTFISIDKLLPPREL